MLWAPISHWMIFIFAEHHRVLVELETPGCMRLSIKLFQNKDKASRNPGKAKDALKALM